MAAMFGWFRDAGAPAAHACAVGWWARMGLSAVRTRLEVMKPGVGDSGKLASPRGFDTLRNPAIAVGFDFSGAVRLVA